MKELSKNEMLEVTGSGDITSTIVSTYIKCFGQIYEIGKSFGSAIRRLVTGKICKI